MKHSGVLKRMISLVVFFGLSHALLGCAATYNEMQAVVSKTGDHSGTASAEVVAPTPTHYAAVPSPREIFDFHPAGSRPDTFRNAFIINPNDGPLTADVQRSAKELREFMAGLKTNTKTADHKRCSATDVGTAKPGCVLPATKAASRSVTTIQ